MGGIDDPEYDYINFQVFIKMKTQDFKKFFYN